MFKKLITFTLTAVIIASFSSLNALAASTGSASDGDIAVSKTTAISKNVERAAQPTERGPSEKSTMADYQRAKAKGKGFSKGTKVAIGVGVAAAAIGIIVFAASRDKIKTF
ncbi:MAG: hypothetical protein QM785_07725 [Pyrinomonadaceae bacterium]